jgi:hypothetical protein
MSHAWRSKGPPREAEQPDYLPRKDLQLLMSDIGQSLLNWWSVSSLPAMISPSSTLIDTSPVSACLFLLRTISNVSKKDFHEEDFCR